MNKANRFPPQSEDNSSDFHLIFETLPATRKKSRSWPPMQGRFRSWFRFSGRAPPGSSGFPATANL